jgi:hypothetical protein
MFKISEDEMKIIERYKEMNEVRDGTSPTDQKIEKIYNAMEFRSTPETGNKVREFCDDVKHYNENVTKKNQAIERGDTVAENKCNEVLELTKSKIEDTKTQIFQITRENIDTAKDSLDKSSDAYPQMKSTLILESDTIQSGIEIINNLMS